MKKIKKIELETKKELDEFVGEVAGFAWHETECKLEIYPPRKFRIEFGRQLLEATKRIIEGKSLLDLETKEEG